MSREQEISNQLIDILMQVQDTIEKILEIEDQKYDVIKNMEIDQLLIMNEEESIFLHQVELLENKRADLVESLSLKIGFDPQISISKVALLLPEEYKEKILSLGNSIKNICSRIEIITERNQYILNTNVEMISQILMLAQGTSTDQYDSKGLTADIKKQSLHMLDQLV